MSIFPLATNTLRETIRDKILYTILLFAIIMIASGILLRYLSLSQENKIVLDLGLSCINLFGMIITVFVGTNLLSKEIDKKTIYLLLSKPLRRSEFIFGKFLGLCLTLLIITVAMSCAFYLVLWYTAWEVNEFINVLETSFKAIFLIYIELMLLTAAAIFFSTFASPIMSAIFTLGLYVIGHMSNDIISFGKISQSPSLEMVTQAIFYILPDLERLNLKNYLMSAQVSSEVMLGSVGYGLLYATALLLLSVMAFESREF